MHCHNQFNQLYDVAWSNCLSSQPSVEESYHRDDVLQREEKKEREKERERTENMLREIIAIARAVAEGKLAGGKYEEALPAGQTCLRFSVDVFGPCTIQLVPAYLLLADANMGLGKVTRAAELLSQAEWSVSKSPDCGHELHHRLHRSLGRLQSAMDNPDDALFHFSNDIYYAAEVYGSDSTVCCNGYFLMADIFARQGKKPIVRSMYNEVVQTWHSHLTTFTQTFLENSMSSVEPIFDNAKQVEADKILQSVVDFEQRQARKDHGLIALASHCLCMLWFMRGDRVKARGFGLSALQTGQMSPNQELSGAVQRLLELVDM
ncbi:hypothetical protein WMY93_022003 [Mugilogobius chulae]|uniref:Zinc finger MYND domain-containing protein 12 n=1 Tax=Mugilogobius chulae TaxID=88201 RepID=A0AAW0NCG5_9GOBI